MSFPVLLADRDRARAHKVGLRPLDVEESFIKGGGHGGQKINKTANCVYLLHVPTGFQVKCQEHRERERNRAEAYRRLIDKLEQRILGEASKRAKTIYKIKRQKQKRSRRTKAKLRVLKEHRSETKQRRKKGTGE